jgi:hypothetical protein
MVRWVSKQITTEGCGCPKTEAGQAAWRAWFTGGDEVALAGLRDMMVQVGWDADKTIAFFQKAAERGDCGGSCGGNCRENCDGERSGDCGNCPKAEGAAPTADAGDASKPAPTTTEVPTSDPTSDAAPAAGTTPETTETASEEKGVPTPMHAIVYWVATQVMPDNCACPSTPEGATAWRAWFASETPVHASLRDALVKHGWTADRTIGFFEKMASGDCDGGECPNACRCKDGATCPKCAGERPATTDASTPR